MHVILVYLLQLDSDITRIWIRIHYSFIAMIINILSVVNESRKKDYDLQVQHSCSEIRGVRNTKFLLYMIDV